jgi:hypothetical protein
MGLATDKTSIDLISAFYSNKKAVAFVVIHLQRLKM